MQTYFPLRYWNLKPITSNLRYSLNMKKLLLLFTLLLPVLSFADTNSSTALIIRKGSDKTLTLMSIPNPNVAMAANQGAPAVTTQNTKFLQLQTDVQAYIALLETGTNGAAPPMNGNLVIVWYDFDLATNVVTVIPDTGQSGTYLAITSSLSTVLNSVLDHLYSGL